MVDNLEEGSDQIDRRNLSKFKDHGVARGTCLFTTGPTTSKAQIYAASRRQEELKTGRLQGNFVAGAGRPDCGLKQGNNIPGGKGTAAPGMGKTRPEAKVKSAVSRLSAWRGSRRCKAFRIPA